MKTCRVAGLVGVSALLLGGCQILFEPGESSSTRDAGSGEGDGGSAPADAGEPADAGADGAIEDAGCGMPSGAIAFEDFEDALEAPWQLSMTPEGSVSLSPVARCGEMSLMASLSSIGSDEHALAVVSFSESTEVHVRFNVFIPPVDGGGYLELLSFAAESTEDIVVVVDLADGTLGVGVDSNPYLVSPSHQLSFGQWQQIEFGVDLDQAATRLVLEDGGAFVREDIQTVLSSFSEVALGIAWTDAGESVSVHLDHVSVFDGPPGNPDG